MTLHFMDSFISFHSCKVGPHYYGARTSNPWENKRSAVRFRLLYVRQANISTRARMNVQCQLRQLQQQQWLILFIVFFNFLEHFFWTLFCFHSCKVDPHWCGAQTSNPWESKTLSGSTPPSLRLANQHQPETYFNNWIYIQKSRSGGISIQCMYLFRQKL